MVKLDNALAAIILNIFNLFQSVRSFVRLLVRGSKNRHLIGRRNDVTANMANLAVCRCFAASRLLDTRASQFGSPGATHTCEEVYCYCLV